VTRIYKSIRKSAFTKAMLACRRRSLSQLILLHVTLCLTGLCLFYFTSTQFRAEASRVQAVSSDPEVHLYHDRPPEGPLLPVLDPKQFDKVVVRNAYLLASKLAPVLYQQPCYCHCSRYLGHRSLLDCYTSKHTEGCPICLKELYYIYDQVSRGQSSAQIREGIVRGDWKAVDLNAHQVPLSGLGKVSNQLGGMGRDEELAR
jgi:Protein of unknown function with PCYCGC motif